MGIVIPPPVLIRGILDALSDHQELSGSQLVEQIPELTRNTVYVTLRRLEEKKIVTSSREDDSGLKQGKHRYYRLTKLGMGVVILTETYEHLLAEARAE